MGNAESALYVNTNKGIFKYIVLGIGIENSYKLKPILNARIPVNSSFTSLIQLHNPYNVPLQVLEIYTSDDDLHLELPPNLAEQALKAQMLDTENESTEATLNSTDNKASKEKPNNPNNSENSKLKPSSSQNSNFIKRTKNNLNHNYYSSSPVNKELWVTHFLDLKAF